MRKYHIASLVLSLAVLTPFLRFRLSAAAGPLPPLVNLAPGTDLRIQQTVDVNVVLIGFSGRIDPATMFDTGALPPWNGVPRANGQGKTFMGQRFDFRYHVTAAPAWFDDELFPFLRQISMAASPIPRPASRAGSLPATNWRATEARTTRILRRATAIASSIASGSTTTSRPGRCSARADSIWCRRFHDSSARPISAFRMRTGSPEPNSRTMTPAHRQADYDDASTTRGRTQSARRVLYWKAGVGRL
jgi:hypothetical protein